LAAGVKSLAMFSGTFSEISKSLIIKKGKREGITIKIQRLIPSAAALMDSLGYIVRRAKNINSIVTIEVLLVLLNRIKISVTTINIEKK
jgi:hypothetical protein